VREQPEAIILGNSFSEIGFDPANLSFTDNGQLKSMNFAMAGSSGKCSCVRLNLAVTHAPIKRALIQIIPEDSMPVRIVQRLSLCQKMSVGKLLLSALALKSSVETVLGKKKKS